MPRVDRSHPSNQARQPVGPARVVVAVSAAALLAVALLLACGGSDNADGGDDSGPRVTMATFTAVPPDYTPEALLTQAARATSFSEEATAHAETTVTAPPSRTGEAVEPRETARSGEVRPPDAVFRTTGGDTFGAIGNSNYLDPAVGAGAVIEAPYVPLPDGAVSWESGSAAFIDVPNSPYAVASALVELYAYDTNVARPTDQQGAPTGELAFYPLTAPAQRAELNGPGLTISANVPPGDYIVSATIEWQAPPEVVQRFGAQFTQYIYVARVD